MGEDENNGLDLNEELDNIVVLNDEDGNEINFEFLDLIEYDGEEYVVLKLINSFSISFEFIIISFTFNKKCYRSTCSSIIEIINYTRYKHAK